MKEINKQEFIKLAKTLTRNRVARHFKICDRTAQRIADDLGIKFKKFVPCSTGRKKIELI